MLNLVLNQIALKRLRIWEVDETIADEASQHLLALELGQLGFKVWMLKQSD